MKSPAFRTLRFVLTIALACGLAVIAGASVPARVPPPPPSLAERYHDPAARLIGAALASDHAYLRLSQLCDGIGHRLSGSPELNRAIAWAQDAMKEDGLERVRKIPAMVPHWVRGGERCVMVQPGPQELSILALGRSPGTPPGGITADVVEVTSWADLEALPDDEVREHIVLFNVPFTTYGVTTRYRGDGPRRAAKRGAIAALVRSVTPTSLRTPHTGAMSDSATKIPAAAVTIEDAQMIHRLLARGERVRVHLELGCRTLPDTLSADVVGELRGREKPEEIVVVGGHLDSWDVGQGAQDDGGGCIISLEAVRLIKQLGLRPRRTIRVCFWTNEENGAKGADAYADSCGKKERHIAAVESDGGVERPTGFGFSVRRSDQPDSTDRPRTARIFERAKAIAPLLAGLGADRFTDEGSDTDTGPLMKLGVMGVAHRTSGEHYFDWHHTRADMLDKVDPIELRKNVAAMAVVLYVLADNPERFDVEPASNVASTRTR